MVPFFDPGLPTEYELTRSIRVVSKSGRKKVGILATDAKMLGGFDFRSMGQETEWPFVTELKKQYEVSSVALDAPIPTNLDVLLVAQPSSLTQKQIDTLTDYVRQGHPTLLFHDPLPMFNPSLAPEVPKMPPGGPFGGGQPPEPKGNLQPLVRPPRGRRPRQRDRLEPLQPARGPARHLPSSSSSSARGAAAPTPSTSPSRPARASRKWS